VKKKETNTAMTVRVTIEGDVETMEFKLKVHFVGSFMHHFGMAEMRC
jgi:hypothetical protein